MADTRKKKVFFQGDSGFAKTGFGKHDKLLLEHLYRTGKYEIIHFNVGCVEGHSDLERTPWKSIGCINPQILQQLKHNNRQDQWESIERLAGYGAFTIDNAVKAEKPDVFIGCQDIWGIDFSVDKPWFDKITSVLWTTLDSLPILPKAVEIAPKVKNYWSWADFATKALNKMGHKHVKTVRGAVATEQYRRLSPTQKAALRKANNIPDEAFVIGFVFRNQLRKGVPSIMEGYSIFKKENPSVKTRLLLHTSWQEGWDIHKFADEYGIDKSEVLTTYICQTCRKYEVKPFTSNFIDCKFCGQKGTNPTQENPRGSGQMTTHPTIGVTETELNEIYNLMDVYCHPFTSGGQEIPIQEAKLAELITLVTNYSCGEDSCCTEAASLPLAWAEYREPGSQFIKATTFPSSIAKQLKRVYNMKPEEKKDLGQKGRQWVLNNFSVKAIGKFLEDFIDNAPFTDYNFEEKKDVKDPNCVIPEISDNLEWVLKLYKDILKMDVDKEDSGVKNWMTQLEKGAPREQVEKYFRQVGVSENQKNNQSSFEDLLGKNDKGRVLFVMPESAGDIYLCTSLFESVRKRYPDWTFYVATKPEYKDILNGNPNVDAWLEYNPMMDNLLWLEGNSSHKGYFDVAYLPFVGSQRNLFYTHNGVDILDFNLT